MAKAGELGTYVVFGMTEKESENDPLYNTSVFVGPDRVIRKYRKCNLWDA
jgi:predicted amidohydrolase